jgi:hypothetical protein
MPSGTPERCRLQLFNSRFVITGAVIRMKKVSLCVVVLLVAASMTSAMASPKSNPNFFSAARAQVALSDQLFKMQVDLGDLKAASGTSANIKVDLDKLLEQAQHETKGRPSLFAAFKGFYLASENNFADVDGSSPVILVKEEMAKRESALQESGNAMMLEAKLAGYVDE